MSGYQLTLTDIKDDYGSPDLTNFQSDNFYLRISDVDMNPDDSFYIEIPGEYASGNVGDLLKYVFPENNSEREERISQLDVDEYGELPDLYDYFYDLLKQEKSGEVVLDFSINFGPVNILLTENVEKHCSLTTEDGEKYKSFHLIVDEYEVPFNDYDDTHALENDKLEFKGLYLHYFISNHGLEKINDSQMDGPIQDAVTYCKEQNLITIINEENAGYTKITLTNQGQKFIQELQDECNYYIEKYDIFSNVYADDEFVDFETEEGVDLRMAAMRYDGLNPYRANMVINMFTGVFDDHEERWEEELRSDKFFARYLGGAAISEIEFTDDEFERIMIEGKRNTGDLD